MPQKKGEPKPQGTGTKKSKPAAVKKAAVKANGPARPKSKTKPKPPAKPAPKPTPNAKPRPQPPKAAQAGRAVTPPTPPSGSTSAYAAHRDKMAGVSRASSVKGREIGGIPDIADPERRERCSCSLKLFCETYNPSAFSLGWSDDHLRAIDRIQEAATQGALFAFAMARGSGKTTICRMAALWATLNAICRYGFVIGATDAKAADTLDSLKTLIRFSEALAADYPEVSWPARCLQGIANRATGQTCDGESTLIDWSGDGVVFPTVPPPQNWPSHWRLRSDGMVPTAGGILSTSGLTGEGIRGSLKTLTTGEMVRPDFVLLDDPQTPESARSKTQNQVREQLVSADVLGMAGPGRSIAAVMPCTVIEPGDFVDRVLDRKKHPLWRGERTGILKSLPADLGAWAGYYEVYQACAQKEPPDFTESNAYYRARQATLEAGGEASWADRKLSGDVSAIQHAMHLRFRDPFAFAAEYMNDPQPLHAISASAIDPEEVARKVTNLERRTVPRTCTRLTAMIDVGAHVLWYAVVAWDERFGGSVIDYGPYPDQSRPYFAAADARPTLGDLPEVKGRPQEAVIYAGLTAVASRALGTGYLQEETGTELHVERCLVDANWGPGTDLVYEFCRRDPHKARLLPSHGKFIGSSSTPIANWQRRDGETFGPPGAVSWRLSTLAGGKRGRHVTFDTNRWKSFVAERLRSAIGATGCLTLFARPPGGAHQMFADHCAAEYPVAVQRQSGGATVDEWKDRPGRDNHLWDCLVGATVAASIAGVRWDSGAAAGAGAEARPERKKVRLSDKFREKHGARA